MVTIRVLYRQNIQNKTRRERERGSESWAQNKLLSIWIKPLWPGPGRSNCQALVYFCTTWEGHFFSCNIESFSQSRKFHLSRFFTRIYFCGTPFRSQSRHNFTLSRVFLLFSSIFAWFTLEKSCLWLQKTINREIMYIWLTAIISASQWWSYFSFQFTRGLKHFPHFWDSFGLFPFAFVYVEVASPKNQNIEETSWKTTFCSGRSRGHYLQSW